MLHSLAIAWPGPFEMILIAGFGLLIFGKRLPEVGRNIGKGIVEFKRGLKEAEHELTSEPTTTTASGSSGAIAPKYKFDPYTGKPIEDASQQSA
ncbi:MAG TPA: twin-arginine translocase TatA/TatE family subunit [Tepidisphaeraceae bacterium]|jgi:TatA/E family protein of Tat protein translocase